MPRSSPAVRLILRLELVWNGCAGVVANIAPLAVLANVSSLDVATVLTSSSLGFLGGWWGYPRWKWSSRGAAAFPAIQGAITIFVGAMAIVFFLPISGRGGFVSSPVLRVVLESLWALPVSTAAGGAWASARGRDPDLKPAGAGSLLAIGAVLGLVIAPEFAFATVGVAWALTVLVLMGLGLQLFFVASCRDNRDWADRSPEAPVVAAASMRRLFLSLVAVLAFGGWGFVAWTLLRRSPLVRPLPFAYNIFYWLFFRYERPSLVILVLFASLTFAFRHRWLSGTRLLPAMTPLSLAIVCAVVVTGIGRLGSRIVMQDYDLAMDEYAESFQSEILATGHLRAVLPPPGPELARGLTPVFIAYRPATRSWSSGILPGFAALRALFLYCGIPRWPNPLLAGFSVLAMAWVARRLWPGEGLLQKMPVLFLAGSCQFLFTGMTDYAMTANLFVNLLWLGLYLTERSWATLLLPVVGVVGLGIHHPVAHAVFAAPFLVQWVFSKRRAWLAYIVPVYLAGALLWSRWPGYGGPGGAVRSMFVFPDSFAWFRQSLALSELLNWQTPLAAILFVAGCFALNRRQAVALGLAGGLLLGFVLYSVYRVDQGHGWGYRYFHPLLGNVCLLAAYGFQDMPWPERKGLEGLAVFSLVTTLFVQIPLRCTEGREVVMPFQDAYRRISSISADVVAVDPSAAWYAQDLVRNDPFLKRRPLVFNLQRASPQEISFLRSAFSGRVVVARPSIRP